MDPGVGAGAGGARRAAGLWRRLAGLGHLRSAGPPVVLQSQASECGLACLAMLAAHHGQHVDLPELRQRFSVGSTGMGLGQLSACARALGLATRPVKLALNDLGQLRLPAVLHWNFNHFVLLVATDGQHFTVLDPAVGERRIERAEVSECFTGVAMEAWPGEDFAPRAARPALKLRSLIGQVRGWRSAVLQILVLSLALEVCALLAPMLMQWVIDHVVVSADRDLLTVLLLGFGLLLLVQQALGTAHGWMSMYLGSWLGVQWQARVLEHLLYLPHSYFERRQLGDVVSRFGEVGTIQSTLSALVFRSLLDALMGVLTLTMMLLYSPRMALVVLVAMLLYVLARVLWLRPLWNATQEQIVHAARQDGHFIETLRGMRAIKLYRRERLRRDGWLAILVRQINASLRGQRLMLWSRQLNGLLFGLENLVVVGMGAALVLDGAFTVGALMAFLAYKGQFVARAGALVDMAFELRMLRLHGERLADIVHTPPEEQASALAALDGPRPTGGLALELRDLRFRYADASPEVLQGVSFTVAPGESLAIVGPSGCGKSTLLHLVLGLLTPTAGEVRIGGRSTAEWGLQALRRRMATVLQDDTLFAGSIADNICFFAERPEPQRIRACAAAACVLDDIEAMPMKFNTLVGDMGAALSGGQRQRILLARALYKRPNILLLDEATSHLDAARERAINESIRRLKITRIIVAHRQETIASADRVFLLSPGQPGGGRLLPPAAPAAAALAAAPGGVPAAAPGPGSARVGQTGGAWAMGPFGAVVPSVSFKPSGPRARGR